MLVFALRVSDAYTVCRHLCVESAWYEQTRCAVLVINLQVAELGSCM